MVFIHYQFSGPEDIFLPDLSHSAHVILSVLSHHLAIDMLIGTQTYVHVLCMHGTKPHSHQELQVALHCSAHYSCSNMGLSTGGYI